MWKLLCHPICTQQTTRYFQLKPVIFNSFKNALSKSPHSVRQQSKLVLNNAKLNISKQIYTFGTITKIGLGITGGALIHVYKNSALCDTGIQPHNSRLTGFQATSDRELTFNWHKFWLYLKPHIWYFIGAIAAALIVAIINIQIPQIMGSFVNIIARVGESKNVTDFLREIKVPGMTLISLYFAQSLFTFKYIYLLSNIGEEIAKNMKHDLFCGIMKQDIAFFDQNRTGEIINRLTTDIQEFKSSFKRSISGGLRAFAQILGSGVTLLLISPQMTFITLLCIPTVIAVGTVAGALLRKISRKAQAQIEKSTAVADEAVGNIRTVRAFAMENQEMELFNNEAESAMILNQQLGFGIGLFQAGTNMFLNGMVLITLYMGGYLITNEQLSPGQLMAYLMATQTIQRSLAQLSLLFGSVIRGLASGARVFEYIEMKPDMPLSGGNTIPKEKLKGGISFEKVTFSYPTRPTNEVLKNFDLHIPPGKTIAIVGASGNGKSTVVALLERFYDINSGSILLDGHDIRTLDPSWLRQHVLGLISQEPVLFGTTVMENIRYGLPKATDEEVKNAAKLANAHNFIEEFPNGYNTMIKGTTLSGGQKQRIAIARALLKNPCVLILDEATSALDTESEHLVQAALDKASEGRTVIVIAHRMSTIKNADIIVVLHKGKIVEIGNHKTLTEKHGFYWSLVYQQQNVAN